MRRVSEFRGPRLYGVDGWLGTSWDYHIFEDLGTLILLCFTFVLSTLVGNL